MELECRMTTTWVRPAPLCFLLSNCGVLVYYAMLTRTWLLILTLILRKCQANLLPANSQALDEVGSVEMLLTACQTTRCHNPEHYTPQPNKNTSGVIHPTYKVSNLCTCDRQNLCSSVR